MKKIFRMALVFALAGATLMYTGCTKDYDEDINNLTTKIDNLTNQHATDVAKLSNDLTSAVSSLQSAIKAGDDAITTAYKAADSALEDAFKAADTELANAINTNKEKIAANEAAIAANAALLKEYKALIDANKQAIDVNAKAIDALEAAVALCATKEELAGAKAALENALAAAEAALKADIAKCATKDELAAADAALKAALDAAVKELKDELAKCATKDELAAGMKELNDALTAAVAELNDAIALCATKAELAEAVKAAEDALAEAKAALEAEIAKCATKDELAAVAEDLAELAEKLTATEEALKAEIAKCATKEELANTVAELKAEIAKCATKEELTSGLASLKSEMEGKLTALETSLKSYVNDELGKVSLELTTKINDLEISMKSFVGDSVDAAKLALQEEFNGKIETANKALDAAKAILLNELRNLYFVPQLYYAGVEAAEYTWTMIQPQAMTVLTKDQEFEYDGTKYVLPAKAQVSFGRNKDSEYGLSQLSYADYKLNPSSFNVDDVKKWELTGQNYRFLVKSEAKKVWTPEYKNVVAKDGVATIEYVINNPELLPNSLYENVAKEIASSAKASVNQVMEFTGAANGPAEEFFAFIFNWLQDLEQWATITTNSSNIAALQEALATLQEDFADVQDAIEGLGGDINGLKTDVNTLKEQMKDVTAKAMDNAKNISKLFVLANTVISSEGTIPVMNLTAELEGGRVISSDYEAVVSDYEQFNALAFSKKSGYKSTLSCEAGDHLYIDARTAIEEDASVTVKYNGSKNLDFVRVHVFDSFEGDQEYTLAELQKVYPGLDMTFELVPYLTGKDQTNESAYGKIVDGVFYPQVVDAEGKSMDPAPNGGQSSIGRAPLVLVKFFNNKDLVLAGYFRIAILDVEESETSTTIDFADFGTIPFVCRTIEKSTKWAQFSALVLEDLGIKYESFLDSYKLIDNAGKETDLKRGETIDAQVYEFDAKNNKFVAVKDNKFGVISYYVDKNTNGVNDAFTWAIDNDAAKAIGQGKSKTVYVKFTKGKYVSLWLSFTVEVAEAAQFDFGTNKLANEWKDYVEKSNTVVVNILVPNEAEDRISNFPYERDLDHYFVGYKPAVDPVGENAAIYKDEKLITSYEYFFADTKKQAKIVDPNDGKSYQLTASADGKKLYAGAVKDGNLIAEIDGKNIVYVYNETSKYFLNLFAHNETVKEKMLYAAVNVKVFYTSANIDAQRECKILAGEEMFYARFLRPLNVQYAEQTSIKEESMVNGANLPIKNFFSAIVDWNGYDVIVEDPETHEMVANVLKGKVDMYAYYEFSDLVIDLDSATRDQVYMNNPSKFYNMKETTPEAKLTFGTADDKDFFTADPEFKSGFGKKKFDIPSLDSLDGQVINYRNDKANVGSFTIQIPVSVNYYWGGIKGTLTVKVKDTTETNE